MDVPDAVQFSILVMAYALWVGTWGGPPPEKRRARGSSFSYRSTSHKELYMLEDNEIRDDPEEEVDKRRLSYNSSSQRDLYSLQQQHVS